MLSDPEHTHVKTLLVKNDESQKCFHLNFPARLKLEYAASGLFPIGTETPIHRNHVSRN